jgi:hypothetical protein
MRGILDLSTPDSTPIPIGDRNPADVASDEGITDFAIVDLPDDEEIDIVDNQSPDAND